MRLAAATLFFFVGLILPAGAWDEDDQPMMLWDGSWVCSTPEAYEEAIGLEGDTGKSFTQIKSYLLENKLCIYIDGEDVEDMMAPYVIVVEEKASKVKVKFWISFYQKVTHLQRRETQVLFTGWTERERLRDFYNWLNRNNRRS